MDPWAARLADATSVDHVLDIVAAYLAALPAGFIASLPAECHPPQMRSPQDVSSYAFVLMHRCVKRENEPALIGMNRFFASASHHLAGILNPGGYTPRPVLGPR